MYLQINIPIHPWLRDHCFDGRVVLPAVETMLLLAAEVLEKYPEIDIRIMENARFTRFLEIPSGSTSIDALAECVKLKNGSIQARLLSRVQFKAMSRIFEHGTILFPAAGTDDRETAIHPEPLNGPVTKIQAKRIYRELVPFGPAYHTLQKTLFLSAQGAWGELKAPALHADGTPEELGSPFPLDGALHATCVHGQQYVNFIPFPVGFDRRIVRLPTRPGESYLTKVLSVARTEDELVYDLGIFDLEGQLYETVTGIRMRKVGRKIKN